MELISVIVPIYKVEAYLDRCIRSIVDQTYDHLEIILVDDGSPDRCGAICDSWAEKDSRIKVIHKANGGLSDARNAGMAVAAGDLISFVDSDDSVAPTFLEQLYQAMTRSGADIAECAISYVNENGTVLRRRDAAPVQVMEKIEALRRLVLEDGIYQTVWNKLYRRHIAAAVPFAVGKVNEDEFWTYQVLDRIGRLAVVRDPLYNYLQRDSSIIGAGYNIRRLDGLEARFRQMEYLQKYEELAVLTRQQLMMNCMWYYQGAARVLQGEEKARAQEYILGIMLKTAPVPPEQMTLKGTHRIWLAMFRRMPNLTAHIRNLLKIGVK